jgi:hypothetical protein
MNWKKTASRYGSLAIGLHWLMLALLIGVYACINLTDFYAKGSPPREALKHWHYMLGLTVLVVVALRLSNRLIAGNPAVVPLAHTAAFTGAGVDAAVQLFQRAFGIRIRVPGSVLEPLAVGRGGVVDSAAGRRRAPASPEPRLRHRAAVGRPMVRVRGDGQWGTVVQRRAKAVATALGPAILAA